MSVRAHRIIEIKNAGETFDLFQDEELVDFIRERCEFFDVLNEDNQGVAEIPVEVLKMALEEIDKLDKNLIKRLQDDINWAEKSSQEFIKYHCF